MILRALSMLQRAAVARRVHALLPARRVLVTSLRSRERPAELFERDPFDALLVDGDAFVGRAGERCAALRDLPEPPEILAFVDHEDPALRARLLAKGILAVVYLGLPDEEIRGALATLAERIADTVLHRLRRELSETAGRFSDFASSSPAMRELLDLSERVAPSDSSLLILGETGVGKEHLARAIHGTSRSKGPFVPVNCAAIPEPLLESELFGHVAGAFTGATRGRRGHFETADRGTLFLDEIGELQPHLQVKLLRVLQEKRVQPLGSERTIDVDARVMAATNCDLAAEMKARKFRSDLYYRLAVVTLSIPPLRDRRDDIAAIAHSHVVALRARWARPSARLGEDALACLLRYDWPGNVRELVNVLERAVLLSADGEILPSHLPGAIRNAGPTREPSSILAAPRLAGSDPTHRPWREAREELLRQFDATYFRELLHRCGGRVGDAAALAGIDPRLLYTRMRELGLRKEDFRIVRRQGPAVPASADPT